MTNIILNGSLAIVGLTALILSLRQNKWGPVMGLVSQPLWFAVGWRSGSWSICLLAFAYGAVWAFGIKKMWRKR